MSLNEYMDALKWILNVAINNQMEAMELPHADENYCAGVIEGLQIALGKIEASRFLAEK